MNKVTIVVPVYDAEANIKRCIDSIVSQTYKDIELLVIDDGSIDESRDIVSRYIERDSRVRLFQQNHKGSNAARKRGLQLATGEYIMFVDSDDFLEKNAIEIMLEKIRKYDVGIVRAESVRCSDGKKVAPILDTGEERYVYHDEIVNFFAIGYKMNSLWGKLYKKSVLDKIQAFESGVDLGEDLLINMEICENLDKILVIGDVLYHYCDDNNNSLTHINDRKRIIKNIKDRIFVSSEMLKFIKKNIHDEKVEQVAIYEQLRMVWEVMKRLVGIDDYTKKDFVNDFGKIFSDIQFVNLDLESLNKYVRKMRTIEKLKNGQPVISIAEKNCDGIWKNFSNDILSSHFLQIYKIIFRLTKVSLVIAR